MARKTPPQLDLLVHPLSACMADFFRSCTFTESSAKSLLPKYDLIPIPIPPIFPVGSPVLSNKNKTSLAVLIVVSCAACDFLSPAVGLSAIPVTLPPLTLTTSLSFTS